MLRLSKKTDYALIALTYVASIGNKATSARDIAERHDIPVELLAKVLQRLVQKGVLKSQQGIHGGYVLARSADTMTVAEIVEAIDGPLMLTVCGTTDERCEQFSEAMWNQMVVKALFIGSTLAPIQKLDERRNADLAADHGVDHRGLAGKQRRLQRRLFGPVVVAHHLALEHRAVERRAA